MNKKYKGIILDIDYFEDKGAEELAALSAYVKEHNVKVGVVTLKDKMTWTKWLKKAPIPVDHVVGSGTIKVRRTSYIRKPEAQPMLVSLAWLELEPKEVLSVCTKDIDREASEKAGMDIVDNPAPMDIIPLLTDEAKPERKLLTLKKAPTTGIFGAVCGDTIGSVYEKAGKRTKNYNFELFTGRSHPTDDSILTMAIAKWLMGDHTDENLAHQLVRFGTRHPGNFWGRGFKKWLAGDKHERRVAGSNGSAMRVSPVGYYASSLEECLALAKQSAEFTHNSPEGIAGAQAIATSIFLVRQGKTKAEVKAYIEQQFGYNLDQTIEEIRDTYNLKERFSLSCNKCACEAIICWLVSDSYEQAVRNAVSLGGDADTIAAMAGGIAAATPGMEIPEEIAEWCLRKLPEDLMKTLIEWENRNEGLPA